jgi:hypothetical protein
VAWASSKRWGPHLGVPAGISSAEQESSVPSPKKAVRLMKFQTVKKRRQEGPSATAD